MKKIIGLLILLVLIVTVASAGCVSNSDLADADDGLPPASYIEQNFDFVGTWVYFVDDDNKMGLGLNKNGEGIIIGEASGEAFGGEITWTEEMLSNGRKYCLLDAGGGPTTYVLSSTDNNRILYFQTLEDVDNWTPIILTRSEVTPTATKVTTTAVKTPTATKSTTIGQDNALRAAINYLSIMPFSYSGLVEQLEYEGYTHSQAIYGADNCGADWYVQAARHAEQYLSIMPFSRDGLYDQLEYEGYTAAQINYALSKVY